MDETTTCEITYDEDLVEDISFPDGNPIKGKGIRVNETRWEQEYFTIPYEEFYKPFDKRFLKTGHIVGVREDKENKRCPYRVNRIEYETGITLILTSCHGGAPDIKFQSRGKHGYKWELERNGTKKPGHSVTVRALSDEFLINQLEEAEHAYILGSI